MKRKKTLFRLTNLLLIVISFICCEEDDPLNVSPQFININDQELTAGETKSIIVTASDPNGDIINLSINNNPGFLTLQDVMQHNNVATATLVIAPEEDDVGVFDVCIVANDTKNSSCENKLKISVNTIIPVLEQVSKQTITTERYKEIILRAYDSGGDNLNITINNKPDFVSIKEIKQVSGTLSAILAISPGKDHKGNYEMSVLVSDEYGGVDSTNIEIEVKDPINVVTVYFCGTGCTKDWWVSNLSNFGTSELVATLYHQQSLLRDSVHNYYKIIIDGIGSSGNLKDILEWAVPSWEGAGGWNKCLTEAGEKVGNIINQTKGDIILNLVGFSRGGILCMASAYGLMGSNINSVNIIVFDPVPGDDWDLLEEFYSLNPKVNHFVGIYAEDERTAFFQPIIPFMSYATKDWMFTMPGCHETMVGNNQKCGHSISILGSHQPIKELLDVSWVVKVISTEILSSNNWGNVKYNWKWSRDKDEFISRYNSIYMYDYSYMRSIPFTPLTIKNYDGGLRFAQRFINGKLKDIGLQNDVNKLNETNAWNEILEMIDKPK